MHGQVPDEEDAVYGGAVSRVNVTDGELVCNTRSAVSFLVSLLKN